jgi:hypothetical protein
LASVPPTISSSPLPPPAPAPTSKSVSAKQPIVVQTTPPPPAPATKIYPNCAALNVDYPHGVGRTGAVDQVRGSTKPVTDFTVDDAVYNANRGRDGDDDGVACEKN